MLRHRLGDRSLPASDSLHASTGAASAALTARRGAGFFHLRASKIGTDPAFLPFSLTQSFALLVALVFRQGDSRMSTIELRRKSSALDHSLTATFEQLGVGIAEVDAAGNLLRVNAYLCELLGYSAGELLGRSIFDPALAEVPETDRVEFGRQVRGEIYRYRIQKRLYRPDGSKLWISITSSSVRDEEGRFLYAVRIQEDITARKHAEDELARRMEEQTALYQFTDSLKNCASLVDIYSHALTAIQRALRCDRAAILMLDASGVMKFEAWRGLSERYRDAVEGHSPWSADAVDPEPVSIENVERAEIDGELKRHVRGEGIAALGFIPIVAEGRLVGKFMTYYDRAHHFANAENGLSLTIAQQIGFAIERMRGETARRNAERAAYQLAAIVESCEDAIISKDVNGIVATWNQGAERLFGYKAEEVVGRPITLLIPTERLNEEPVLLARIIAGERIQHYETLRRRKDGKLIDVSLMISPVRNREGRIVGASKIARDITDRKEAEAKLQLSEQRLQTMISAIPAAIYTTDASGRVTYFNQAAVELAGRVPVLGSDQWCVTWKLYRADGTPLPHDECPMAIALREGREIRDAEAIAERPDGTRVPFIPFPTPLRDPMGNIVGAINMLVDISERKSAENRQRVLFNELNHRVKNNMQTLQSLLHLAGRKTKNSEVQLALQEASNRITAMAAAQQVLYRTISATHFKAQEFVEAVCDSAKHSLPRDVHITREADDVELSNEVAMPLALLLSELITNGSKHGRDANGNANIRVRLKQRGESFLLEVEDDGPGFDLDSVLERSSGLRLVEGLADQIRGTFVVTSRPHARCSVRFKGR